MDFAFAFLLRLNCRTTFAQKRGSRDGVPSFFSLKPQLKSKIGICSSIGLGLLGDIQVLLVSVATFLLIQLVFVSAHIVINPLYVAPFILLVKRRAPRFNCLMMTRKRIHPQLHHSRFINRRLILFFSLLCPLHQRQDINRDKYRWCKHITSHSNVVIRVGRTANCFAL